MTDERPESYEHLTEREREILGLIANGLSNQEIAAQLFLTIDTVKWYNSQIYQKLGVRSRIQAVTVGRERGLLAQIAPVSPFKLPLELPLPTTIFIGRERELEEIQLRLADARCRLLTLVGPGGIGKTRLALEAAAQFVTGHPRTFPNGVGLVSLQALNSPDFIVSAIAEAVHFQLFSADSLKRQLLAYLRDKTFLLILDNFEHLLDGAALVSEILAAAPKIKILVTSREALNLQEEWLHVLAGMAYPHNLENVERYESIQLFRHHAERIRSNFSLDEQTEGMVRICTLAQGMPLALELSANWVRVLSCEEIANEIEHSLDILETSARNVEPRHRTMRAVFEPTWDRLTNDERNVFMRLSVFRGGFTREAAEAVAGSTLRTLTALVDRSLLDVKENGRYNIHELLRQYGLEHLLQSGDFVSTRDRHSAYYADFCWQREADIQGRRQIEALNEMEADFENVRTAWLWAVEQRNPDRIDRALESGFLYCEMRGRFYEMEDLIEQAYISLTSAMGEEPHPLSGRLLARSRTPRVPEGIKLRRENLQQALALAQQFENLADIGYCFWRLGEYSVEYGSLSDALPLLEQSLAHYRESGKRYYIAKVLNEFGRAYRDGGESETALGFQQQSLDLRREIGDLRGVSWCLYDRGRSLYQMGRYAQAEQDLEEASGYFRKLNDRFGLRSTIDVLGNLALLKGEFERAKMLSEEALKLANDLGVQGSYSGRSLTNLGALASLQGDYALGQQLCQQSLEVTNWGILRSFIYWGMSLAACGLENYLTARQSLVVGLSDAFKNDHMDQMLRFLPVAAIILAHESQPLWAVELLGLTFTYPDNLTAWLEKWLLLTRLRTDLEVQLGTEAYMQAWEQGKDSRIKAVIAALLSHFQAENESNC